MRVLLEGVLVEGVLVVDVVTEYELQNKIICRRKSQ